jgi:glycosyltransferase involved in cell wall biosynthesis
MMDKISIVVPAYNVEKYIENTVKSICEQTYRNLEIILVDDGSKDGTYEILNHLSNQDERIHVIHKENGGVTRARIAGIEVATGEWIGFVDGDDFVEPNMYERLMENAIKYNADISHCGYQMIIGSRIDMYYGTGRVVEQDNITGLRDLLSGSFVEPGLWNKLFHKSLFQSLLQENVMDFSIKNNEDLLMNYYLFKKSQNSIYEDICPYHYVVRNNSATQKELNIHKLLDPIKVQQILMIETKNIPELYHIPLSRYIVQLIGLATMSDGKDSKWVKNYKIKARKKLRDKLIIILKKREISRTIKIKAVWVSIFPISYECVHSVYLSITGLNKKYSVE